MRMASLSWALCIGLPMANIYLGSGNGFNRNQQEFYGASLSILGGGIFNHDDIPIESRSILEGYYQLALSCGEDWASFSHILVILDQNPHGCPFNLLLSERCMILRPEEGTREYMDTNGSLTDGHSSDEDYSLSGNE